MPPKPVPVPATYPAIRSDWMIDCEPTRTGWTLAHVRTPRNDPPARGNWLHAYKGGRTSAWGEEGMLDHLLALLGSGKRWCCEFGAGDGVGECNSFTLVNEHGWNAVYIEPDTGKFDRLAGRYADSPTVVCLNRAVGLDGESTLDNILSGTSCPRDLDVMIIDVDGNDLPIWNSITEYRARIVVIEFNATIQPGIVFAQPADFSVNQGSSLEAMIEAGRRLGYALVATTTWNAFFVRADLLDQLPTGERDAESLHEGPTRFRLFQLYDGTLLLGGWAMLHWSPVRIALEDLQVLPRSLRRFSRDLARSPILLEPDGTATPAPDWRGDFIPAPDNRLAAARFDGNSDFGDDGILDALLDALGIDHPTFLDIGSFGDREGSRTCRLSTGRGGSGAMVRWAGDPGPAHGEAGDGAGWIDVGPPEPDEFDAWARSIQDRMATHDVDVLSIQVDGADYHVWRSFRNRRPSVVAVSFNPTVPNDVFFVQCADITVHQGTSLQALAHLAGALRYKLAACSLATAFFVPEELFDRCGVHDVGLDIDRMYRPGLCMHLFQLYDGSLRLHGLDRLLWQGLRLGQDEIQILPRSLRRWYHRIGTESAQRRHFYVG